MLAELSPIYYWPIAGNTSEVVNGRHMQNLTNTALIQDRLNYVNSALYFDGSTTTGAFVPAGIYFNQAFSFSLWLIGYKNEYARFLDFYSPAPAKPYFLEYYGDDRFEFVYDYNTHSDKNALFSTPNTTPINIWTHVAITVNGAINKIYINGVFNAMITMQAPHVAGATNINMFGTSSSWSGPFPINGAIDEIKIYNGTLSDAGVLADFNSNPMLTRFNAYHMTPGLQNYWPFDNSLTDVVTGLDMIEFVNGSFGADHAGNMNLSLHLSDGYVSAPPGVYFNPTGYTIMAWVKLNSYVYNHILLGFSNGDYTYKGSNPSPLRYKDSIIFLFQTTTGAMISLSRNGDNTGNTAYTLTGTNQVALNVWTHVATTSSATTSSIYFNGVLVGQGAITGSFPTNVNRTMCKIGKGFGYDGFDGAIDELKIFNRALASTEILAEMAYTKMNIN